MVGSCVVTIFPFEWQGPLTLPCGGSAFCPGRWPQGHRPAPAPPSAGATAPTGAGAGLLWWV